MRNEQPDFVDVPLSAASLWARRGWIVFGVVLGAVLAAAFTFAQPETNRSWAQVLIRPLGVDPTRGSIDIDRAIDSVAERELAGSFIVAERVAAETGGVLTARTLRREVDIEGVGDAPVLEISYADNDAQLAQQITQSFAEHYLEIRSEVAEVSVQTSRTALDERRQEILVELDELIRDRNTIENEDDRIASVTSQTLLSNQLSQLANDLARLEGLTSDPGVVISPAQLAESSERPRTLPTVLAGSVLGGLLGVLAALFFDRAARDQDVSDDDLQAMRLQPVARLPRESYAVDAFSGLERWLNEQDGAHSVLALATLSAAGPTSRVAPSVAWNMALAGKRVLLVSADFQADAVSRHLGLAAAPGLIDALVGGWPPARVIRSTGNLDVVSAGDHAADPAGVLQMFGLQRFINDVRGNYDLVVVTAPDLLTQESSVLAIWGVDATLLLIDQESRRSVEQASEILAGTDTVMLGSVLLTDTKR